FNEGITLHFLSSYRDSRILGAFGLSLTFLNLTCMAIFFSLNMGLTGKAAHAYGAKDYKLVGLYFHRSLLVKFIIFIPCCCCFYWSDKLCLWLNYEEQTAVYIQQLLCWSIPGLFAVVIFTTLSAYLNACNIFVLQAVIQTIACVIYWITSYLFVIKF